MQVLKRLHKACWIWQIRLSGIAFPASRGGWFCWIPASFHALCAQFRRRHVFGCVWQALRGSSPNWGIRLIRDRPHVSRSPDILLSLLRMMQGGACHSMGIPHEPLHSKRRCKSRMDEASIPEKRTPKRQLKLDASLCYLVALLSLPAAGT